MTRILLAFILSATCYAGVEYWYRTQRKSIKYHDQRQPIAAVTRTHNSVRRRPQGRLFWEIVDRGESLFAGEMLRTAAYAQATVIFESGLELDLEPDSLVLIEKSATGLAIDFVKGNLFIKKNQSQSNNSPEVSIKSGDQQIEISANTEASISGGQGRTRIDVARGLAVVRSGTSQTTIKENSSGQIEDGQDIEVTPVLEITHPKRAQTLLLNPNDKLRMAWQPVSGLQQLEVLSGTSIEALKVMATPKTAATSTELSLPAARQYLQLRGQWLNPKTKKRITVSSAPIAIDLNYKTPPALIFPPNQHQITVTQAAPNVRLEWFSTAIYDRTVVEIWQDAELTKKVFQKEFSESVTETTAPSLAPGTYQWRVTSFVRNPAKTAVSSAIQNFKISLPDPLLPPTLISPALAQSLTYDLARTQGVLFSYQPRSRNSRHHVIWLQRQNKEGQWSKAVERISEASPFVWPQLKPGTYRWSAQAVAADQKTSELAAWQEFNIQNIPELRWVQEQDEEEQLYVTQVPVLELAWHEMTDAHQYRVRGIDLSSTQKLETLAKRSPFSWEMRTPGSYKIRIEALSLDGQKLSQSRTKTYHLKMRPFLDAPRFTSDMKPNLITSARGQIELRWQALAGAKTYEIRIKDAQGRPVENFKTGNINIQLDHLRPGKYAAELIAYDEYNRRSQSSDRRSIEVPSLSDIPAPNLKNIKIK